MCQSYTKCVQNLVVDSSALITLAGADALSLFGYWQGAIWTIPEVYSETVDAGIAKGYPDAGAIQQCFVENVIRIKEPRNSERLTGLSLADSRVVLLAGEMNASCLLVNDHALLKRSEHHGIPARFTAEFVKELHEKQAISRRRMIRLFEAFLQRQRYSEEFLNALLTR